MRLDGELKRTYLRISVCAQVVICAAEETLGRRRRHGAQSCMKRASNVLVKFSGRLGGEVVEVDLVVRQVRELRYEGRDWYKGSGILQAY